MKRPYKTLIGATLFNAGKATAQAAAELPPFITTSEKVEMRIGTVEFKDGVPTLDTAEKVRDTLDFTRALNAYNNTFRGASALRSERASKASGLRTIASSTSPS
jgi:hypothetical protein